MEKRIDETIEYFTKNNADLAFIYYNQPDNAGHHTGTSSDETKTELQLIDWYLSYLMVALERAGLGEDKLNVILCADHGMTTIKERLVLEDYIDLNDVEIVSPSLSVVEMFI